MSNLKLCDHSETKINSNIEADNSWHATKDTFEVTDVRNLGYDPFEVIMEIAKKTNENEGFAIIQTFEPIPLINILIAQGFSYHTEQQKPLAFKVYFFKNKNEQGANKETTNSKTKRLPVVIQSATPVVYPIIQKMLQSKKLNDHIEITELKVWEETEKHMAWITNGKADFTFSAIVASSKLYSTGQDIKLLSIDVWDNFNLITRGYEAKSFKDLLGHTIHMPLFKSAPPYAVTSYLMEMENLNPNDFSFEYGEPFGRPHELQQRFVKGEIDTVLLREPEASFVFENLKNQDVEVYSFNYGDIWKNIHPEFDKLPNAGLIVKGELFKNHREIVELFVEELSFATKWVKENPAEAAEITYREMGVTYDEAKLFCERVVFEHQPADQVKGEVIRYIDILKEQGIVKLKKELDDAFFGI